MPNSKKILITGVAGFIGRGLSRYFARIGKAVYGIDRVQAENAPLSDLAGYVQDELNSSQFEDFLRRSQPDIILHCAGRASVPGAMQDPRADYTDGPVLTFSLLNRIRQIQPDCAFINISSAAVYGNPQSLPISERHEIRPISSYGFHKWQSEIICQEFSLLWGIKTASARVFSAYGPGLHRQVLWDIAHKALTQPEVRLQGTGQESRDFIHIQDIARGLEIILQNAKLNGEVYNLASGVETSIAHLSTIILDSLQVSSKVTFSAETPSGTPKNWRANIDLLQSFGFTPQIPLEAGARSFALWARSEIRGE
jgi:UDP-glucose 4-epimerase